MKKMLTMYTSILFPPRERKIPISCEELITVVLVDKSCIKVNTELKSRRQKIKEYNKEN